LDEKTEKWLRFEIELSQESEDKASFRDSATSNSNMGPSECLNLSLYDQADPSNLYLATIDYKKFEKLMNKQSLMIEQFSQLAGHI
jgi:hypothetical protein